MQAGHVGYLRTSLRGSVVSVSVIYVFVASVVLLCIVGPSCNYLFSLRVYIERGDELGFLVHSLHQISLSSFCLKSNTFSFFPTIAGDELRFTY